MAVSNALKTTSGDLCEYITSGSRDWKSYYSDRGAIFIRTQDINKDRLDLTDVARVDLPAKVEGKRSLVQPGDLLVTITGANVGKVALVPDDVPEAYVSQSVGLMRLRDRRIGPYLHYYMQSSPGGRKALLDMVYGIGRPVLSLKNLREIPVSLPPLDEQRRIVAELETQLTRLDASVAALKRVQANLKRYHASVLKAACEGRLVPTEAELARREGRTYECGAELLARVLKKRQADWNGRGVYAEPALPVTARLPELAEGWALASLEQLTSATRVICYGILMPKDHVEGGVLYVKVRDLKGDRVDVNSLQRTSPEIAAQYARASLTAGDLLLAIRGTYGRVAEVPRELEGGNITQDTARVAVNDLVDRRYVAWFLRSDDAQTYFKRVARGVAVKGVNIGDVRPCPILLPPLAEQHRIAAEVERRLSVIEEIEASVAANLKRAGRLRQSILAVAFQTDQY